MILFFEREVIGGRCVQVFDVDAWRGLPYAHQTSRIGIWQRLEHNTVHDTEDCSVRATPIPIVMSVTMVNSGERIKRRIT